MVSGRISTTGKPLFSRSFEENPLANCLFWRRNAANMAKKCWIKRDERKRRTVEKYAKLREELKAKGDYVGLSMLPRDASPTRTVNRCKVTGRRHGYLRRFKMSRLAFREMASYGLIPGVTKSSW